MHDFDKKLRLLVVHQTSAPYLPARYDALLNHYKLEDLFVLEFENNSSVYSWGPVQYSSKIKRIFLVESRFDNCSKFYRTNLVYSALKHAKPGMVLIAGYGLYGMRAAIHWCLINKVPYIIFSDSQYIDKKRHWITEMIKSFYVKKSSGALVAGLRHKDYLVSLGLDADKIRCGYDVVDNERFIKKRHKILSRESYYRNLYSLPYKYFIVVSRLVVRKNIFMALDAFSLNISRIDDDVFLLIIGSGPLKADLISYCYDLGIHKRVTFIDYVSYAELPIFYSLSICLLLTSQSEQWGLVVNEALASGVPALVSTNCGSSELIRDGFNGYKLIPDDRVYLANLMLKMLAISSGQATSLSDNCQQSISDYDVEKFSLNLSELIDNALLSKPPAF